MQAIATKEATANQDPGPTSIATVESTLRSALAVGEPHATWPINPNVGEAAWLNSMVYLVVMKGNFVLTNAPVPAGDSEPAGPEMYLIIDAHTGHVEGMGLGEGASDKMTQLGQVTALEG